MLKKSSRRRKKLQAKYSNESTGKIIDRKVIIELYKEFDPGSG